MSINLYYYMFPYFLYPMNSIILCLSIFLVLAIAFERFLAVCHPYDYRIFTSTRTIQGRVFKLTAPVFVIAVVINIPKFFETKLVDIVSETFISDYMLGFKYALTWQSFSFVLIYLLMIKLSDCFKLMFWKKAHYVLFTFLISMTFLEKPAQKFQGKHLKW